MGRFDLAVEEVVLSWIVFLVALAVLLAGVGMALEAMRWLLLVSLLVLLTSGLVGWSRRGANSRGRWSV